MKKLSYLLFTFLVSANLMAEIQISGIVKSAAGTPIENAAVSIFDEQMGRASIPLLTTFTDKNGNYKIVMPKIINHSIV